MPKNGMRARMARRQRRRQWNVRNLAPDFSQTEARVLAHLISNTPVDPTLTTGRLVEAPPETQELTSEEKTRLRRQRQNERRKQERVARRTAELLS